MMDRIQYVGLRVFNISGSQTLEDVVGSAPDLERWHRKQAPRHCGGVRRQVGILRNIGVMFMPTIRDYRL